jgi:protein-S-isoprenylcysteine O-methyltransferase Ste14
MQRGDISLSKKSLYMIFYVLLLTSGFIILRFLVPRDYLKRGKLSPLIAFLQALLFFAYGGFPYLYLEKDWPAVSVHGVVQLTGALFIFVGLSFLMYGMIRLGVNKSIGRGAQKLEQSGIYSVSRNPQAIACGLYVLGFLMLWPSWYAVGWGFLYFVLIHMMVLAEEEHLQRIHGQRYQAYCEQVPRYFSRRYP